MLVAGVVLVLTALALLAAMALVVVLLLRRRERTFDRFHDLRGAALAALLLGVVAMAGLAAARVLVERSLAVSLPV